MKKYLVYLAISLIAVLGAYYLGRQHTNHNISPARCKLRTNMRKLWADHVWWTREYLISAISDLPDLDVVTNRLLQNQSDLGAAIAPYYGQTAGDKLTSLLKEHILIAADVVAAAKAGDDKKLKTADARWHLNADEIATFLSSANPNWPQAQMQKMMYEHLNLTTAEAVARLKKDWPTDVATFEKVFAEIMMMADDLTAGIAKQFPNKF